MAATPADREERLKVLREELPRRERRVLRIPSPGAAEKAAEEASKARAVEKRIGLRECPRCHEKFADLASHKDACPKKVKVRRWELAGPPATAPIDWSKAQAAPEIAPWPATESKAEEAMNDKKEVGGLELVERCLVLADMLWPDTRHAFTIASIETWRAGLIPPRCVLAMSDYAGEGTTPAAAVRALADALRAEVTDRQRKVADLAKLLED